MKHALFFTVGTSFKYDNRDISNNEITSTLDVGINDENGDAFFLDLKNLIPTLNAKKSAEQTDIFIDMRGLIAKFTVNYHKSYTSPAWIDLRKAFSNYLKDLATSANPDPIFFLKKNIKSKEIYSAELSSLKLLYENVIQNGDSVDAIYLFPTYTKIGLITSIYLADFIHSFSRNCSLNITLRIVLTPSLKSANKSKNSSNNSEDFKVGLRDFTQNLVFNIREELERVDKIFLLPNGGYKSIVPYVTLAGILTNQKHNIQLFYTYENSESLIELPTFPLNIDLSQIKPYIYAINKIEGTPVVDNSDFKMLPPQIRNMFTTINNSDDKEVYTLSDLGQIFIASYKAQIGKPSYSTQASFMPVLKYFLDQDRKKFDSIVKISSQFWHGDQLPEMVDHAYLHHNNLFEFADYVLSNILTNDPNLISSNEVYWLLSAIYFHDWGHVQGEYYPQVKELSSILLLPTEIRDYHHILGYQRLKYESDHLLKELLRDDFFNGNKYWEEFEPVALIGLYHRQKMKLTGDTDTDSFKVKTSHLPDTHDCFVSLEKYLSKLDSDKKNKYKNLPLLVALFRLIDSFDAQRDRVGSDVELKFKLLSYESEMRQLSTEAEKLHDIISNGDSAGNVKTLNTLVEKMFGAYAEKECNNNTIHEKHTKENNPMWLQLKKGLKIENPFLEFMYLQKISKICLKLEQLKHFSKHLLIERNYLSYSFHENKHIICVDAKLIDETTYKGYLELINASFDRISGYFETNHKGSLYNALKGVFDAIGIKVQENTKRNIPELHEEHIKGLKKELNEEVVKIFNEQGVIFRFTMEESLES